MAQLYNVKKKKLNPPKIFDFTIFYKTFTSKTRRPTEYNQAVVKI